MIAEHKDEEAIFKGAVKLKSAAKRTAYLKRACGNDAGLLARIEELLKAHDEAGDFLESPPADVTLNNSGLTEGPGSKVGRYKLLQLIGEGGFACVYMAEQEQPVRRRVALKIIKLGMDTKQVIGRFEAERQALALMEHPNIAKVFDGGATDTGRPYFVMELVKGIPITEYCDKDNVGTKQRLELFIDVCKAVQHAHQKGIIHRDIKPTNVLITLRDDGTPVPKIIDFGIAKATGQKLTEKTYFTEFKQFIGTPEYMSPEQAQMGEMDIDTRTDIYSLGVLLYELLAGTTPFNGERLRSSAYDEMLKTIRETEPPRPSTRLNTLGDALADVAKHRNAEPAQLCKIVRGELDWIVMKTLEKDRTRRYETANELARDIERHMNNEPVTAGPPSTVYRVSKFVRRNRTAVAVVLSIMLALVVGLLLATVGFVRASHERNRAVLAETEAITQRDAAEQARRAEAQQRQRASVNFEMARDAVNEMTRVAEEELVDVAGSEQVRRELLQKAQVFYSGFAEQNRDDPAVLEETGWAYERLYLIHKLLGNYDQSEQAIRQAIAIFEGLSNDFPNHHQYRRSLASAFWSLGVLFKNHIRDKEEALKMYRRSFELRAELVEEFPNEPAYVSDLAWSHVDLGLVLSDLGRYQEAMPELRRALLLRKQLVARFPNVVEYLDALAHSHHWLGSRLLNTGQLAEAEQHLRQTLKLREQLSAEDPNQRGNLAHIKSYVGKLLLRQGKAEEAEEEYREAIAIRKKLIEEFPGHVGHRESLVWLLNGLGTALKDRGLEQEAEDTLRQGTAYFEALAADFPEVAGFQRDFAWCVHELGNMLAETGKLEEAVRSYQRAIEIREKLVADFPDVAGYPAYLPESYRGLGDVLKGMGRLEEAQEAYKKAEEIRKEVEGEEKEQEVSF